MLSRSLASRLSPLASRLSPLGVVAALLICFPLLCSSRAACAADWGISYSPAQFGGTESGLCPPNSGVSKTKTVMVTATLTWIGSGPAPKRVKVNETATVSWRAGLNRLQNGGLHGGPPQDPNGNMSGSGSTSLTDTAVSNPNPSTNAATGQDITGTREGTYTVPDNGVLVLPAVTLTATATATTGDVTTGSALVNVGTYSASVPDGWARAEATVQISAGSGWVRSVVDYKEMNDGSYSRELYDPSITVSVGGGTSKTKSLNPEQTFTFVTDNGNPPADFTGSIQTAVSGSISELGHSYFAESTARVNGSYAPDTSSGHAPNGNSTGYGVSSANIPYRATPTADPGKSQSVLTVNMHLDATASTIGH